MKLSKVDNLVISIEINGQSATIAAPDLIASLAATVGPDHWIDDLINAHMELSHAFFNHGDVGTEPYDWSDPDAGPRLEAIAGAVGGALCALKKNGVPMPVDGEYSSPWENGVPHSDKNAVCQ